MNPLLVAPTEIYVAFAFALVAIVLASYVLIFLSITIIVLIFWYCRGADNAVMSQDTSITHLIAPCDGTITNVYCDIQRLTHIEMQQIWYHRHGVYTVFGGEVIDVEVEKDGTTRFVVSSEIGRIDYAISNNPRIIALKGDKLQKGDVLCFVLFEATISVVLPVYQSSINLSKNQSVQAGNVIGTAEQVWSL